MCTLTICSSLAPVSISKNLHKSRLFELALVEQVLHSKYKIFKKSAIKIS